MTFAPKQDNFNIQLRCQFISDAIIARAEIIEHISRLFQCNVFLHTGKQIEIDKILNQKATILIKVNKNITRYFTGIIDSASFENIPNIISKKVENILYIRIVPNILKLNYYRKYKIYQDKSLREIIQDIFKANQISDYKFALVNANNNKIPFCVQYAETDLHFISRLLEENGIFYYFNHKIDNEILLLSDNSLSGDKLNITLDLIKNQSQELYPETGLVNISMTHGLGYKNISWKSYNPDQSNVINSSATDAQNNWKIGSDNYYDNLYKDKSAGDNLSKIILSRNNASAININGSSYNPEIYPGAIVKLNGSTTKSHNGEFFILSVKHTINQLTNNSDQSIYQNTFEAIPQDIPYKPMYTHHKTRIYGCQTAIVIGPEKEEVYYDKDGRVKVKFHWAEDESCWIRVVQALAGKGFGALILPRIGMEVLVSFINGDPDQPIITGCLYNGTHQPPGEYPLKGTISSFYSNSIKGKGFNELRINDKEKEEEIYIHAQKDFNKVIGNSINETLNEGSKIIVLESKNEAVKHELTIKNGDNNVTIEKGNNSLVIKEGNYTIELSKGNQIIKLSNGNQNITLSSGDLTIDVTGNINIKSSKDVIIKTGGEFRVESSKDTLIKSSKSMNFNASSNYSLKASQVSVNASSSLSLSGNRSTLSGGMSCTVDGTSVSISGSTIVKVSGGFIKLN